MNPARRAASAVCALVLTGCVGGVGYVDYVDEEASGSAFAAVEVVPAEVAKATPATPEARDPAVTSTRGPAARQAGGGGAPSGHSAGGWDAKAFLKDVPANPVGRPDDGLVASKAWSALGWANPAYVSVWKRGKPADDVVLVVRLEGGKHDKAAVSRPVALAFAPKGEVRVDVYNSTARKISVAFAVFASVDRVYSESRSRTVRPGWNRIAFDLSASTYKTAASEWKHTAALWGADDVREFVLLFYDKEATALAIDSVEVDVRPRPGALSTEADVDRR